MCSSPKPPDPVAPPAPVPVRDSRIDATRERQVASRRAANSGYSSTMLTGPGGLTNEAASSSPVLGG